MEKNSPKRILPLTRKQLIIGVIILFFIICIFAIITFIIDLPKTTKISILVSPTDSKVTLNQVQYSSGNQKVIPGEYKIKIERQGFNTEETEIKIGKNEHKYIYYCLKPDEEHKNWFKEHKKDQEACDQVNQALNEIQKSETMQDPIFSVTPYHSDEKRFYIDSELNKDHGITVKIRPMSCKTEIKNILKQNALNYLKSQNINPEQYKIEYIEDC